MVHSMFVIFRRNDRGSIELIGHIRYSTDLQRNIMFFQMCSNEIVHFRQIEVFLEKENASGNAYDSQAGLLGAQNLS